MTAQGGSPEWYVFAIDPRTGTRRWATSFPFALPVALASAGGGAVYLLAGMHLNELIALDARTGAHLWTATGPAVPAGGNVTDGVIFSNVLGTDSSSDVVALDTATGNVLWKTKVAGNAGRTTAAAGVVYVASSLGTVLDGVPTELYAFHARTGRQLWKRHFGEGAFDLFPAGPVLYTGIDAGIVHALDSMTGQVLWTYQMQGYGSFVVPAPGTVYLSTGAASDSPVFALQA